MTNIDLTSNLSRTMIVPVERSSRAVDRRDPIQRFVQLPNCSERKTRNKNLREDRKKDRSQNERKLKTSTRLGGLPGREFKLEELKTAGNHVFSPAKKMRIFFTRNRKMKLKDQ